MVRLLRALLGALLVAHALVHLTIYPGADAYGGGRLGWDGTARFDVDVAGATTLTVGHTLVLATVALGVAAGLALLVRPLIRVCGALAAASSVLSLATLWWVWPGLLPDPGNFWRGPWISAAVLAISPLLVLAGRDAGTFARSPIARSVVATWGSTPIERADTYACDALIPDAPCQFWRAVDVDAPAHVLFRWLGQMRLAPYSYDLLDNRGRRSPRTLDRTLPPLAPGQSILGPFVVAEVDPDRALTLTSDSPPPTALTYRVAPTGPTTCRLVVKACATPTTALGALLLVVCDFIMMRRQLLTFASLAGRSSRVEIVPPSLRTSA